MTDDARERFTRYERAMIWAAEHHLFPGLFFAVALCQLMETIGRPSFGNGVLLAYLPLAGLYLWRGDNKITASVADLEEEIERCKRRRERGFQ